MPRTACPSLGFVQPMLPTSLERPPEGEAWLHEIKYDGCRTQLIIEGWAVHVSTRNGHDWTERYAAIVDSVRRLSCGSAVIDGEICVQTEVGVTDFGALCRIDPT